MIRLRLDEFNDAREGRKLWRFQVTYESRIAGFDIQEIDTATDLVAALRELAETIERGAPQDDADEYARWCAQERAAGRKVHQPLV